ncbi:MAG: tyrosine--tRNA ligase [Candidatus Komeilibacteria bacterium]|nr:tyrosine--tRNA ligase [Candidatus Komeilibacteria bacterium]
MANKRTDKQIDELLKRGIDEVIDRDSLRKKLKSGKKLRVKLGIDPTSPNLHIGRSIPLLKLRDFQQLGHKIVFIVGDFTGVIGDTSDKDSERPMLTDKQVKQNMKDYIKQAGKVIDIKKCEVHFNSKWLKKLNYHEVGRQADNFSLNEFISRENIKKRLDGGKRVSLRELLYPLMQGYDSVAVKADVEVGGTDQRFNLLAGRELQRHYGQPAQDIITNPLIEGLDGRKMSSSWGNVINLWDKPADMFGKVMSLRDDLIIRYFVLTTRVEMDTVKKYEADLAKGSNPRDIKMKLGYELVRFYHSEREAEKAQATFVKIFSDKQKPSQIPVFKSTRSDLLTILVESGAVSSKTEARRAVEQGGVKINDEVAKDSKATVKKGDVVQKGKRFFIKIG